MQIVEQRVINEEHEIFDLDEFLSRPLFAHLATSGLEGPCDSPVWFYWDGASIWIIGGRSFPANLRRKPRCAIGIVDFERCSGRVQHVGMRGSAQVLPYQPEIGLQILRKYLGAHDDTWDPRFEAACRGDASLELVRFTPKTVVMRDQSYHPPRWD